MNENLDPTNQNYNAEELDLEKKLRPLSFDDFTGQEQVLDNLKVFVQAANLRGEALDHTLFHGLGAHHLSSRLLSVHAFHTFAIGALNFLAIISLFPEGCLVTSVSFVVIIVIIFRLINRRVGRICLPRFS